MCGLTTWLIFISMRWFKIRPQGRFRSETVKVVSLFSTTHSVSILRFSRAEVAVFKFYSEYFGLEILTRFDMITRPDFVNLWRFQSRCKDQSICYVQVNHGREYLRGKKRLSLQRQWKKHFSPAIGRQTALSSNDSFEDNLRDRRRHHLFVDLRKYRGRKHWTRWANLLPST